MSDREEHASRHQFHWLINDFHHFCAGYVTLEELQKSVDRYCANEDWQRWLDEIDQSIDDKATIAYLTRTLNALKSTITEALNGIDA